MLAELIAAFPGVASLVDQAVGSEWEWDRATQTYLLSSTA